MAKHQHLSSYQRGIVNRYYQNLDTLTLTKLQELVSELFLSAGDAKAGEKLWKRAEALLAKAGASEGDLRRAVERRDVKVLAEVVAKLSR